MKARHRHQNIIVPIYIAVLEF